jgi:hypothetical protein
MLGPGAPQRVTRSGLPQARNNRSSAPEARSADDDVPVRHRPAFSGMSCSKSSSYGSVLGCAGSSGLL